MGRPLSLVLVLAVLSAGFAFVGTLLTAPSPFLPGEYGRQVRATAARNQWARVAEYSRRMARSRPREQEVLLFWGLGSERSNNPEQAAEVWERLAGVSRENIRRGSRDPAQWYYLGWGLRGIGDEPGAAQAWGELVRLMGDGVGFSGYNAACYHALAGNTEEALAAWERFGESGDRESMGWIRVDPDLDAIRDEARFRAVLERMRDRYRRQGELETRI